MYVCRRLSSADIHGTNLPACSNSELFSAADSCFHSDYSRQQKAAARCFRVDETKFAVLDPFSFQVVVKMDCEALIEAVKERPPIWDITNKSHHNRQYLDKLWDDIRKKAGSSKDKCRKKWKYLKDRFRTELRKERLFIKSGRGDGFEFKTKFAYFEQMAFMRKQMWIGKTEDQFLEYPPVDETQYQYDDSMNADNMYDHTYQVDPPDINQYSINNAEYRLSGVEAENNSLLTSEENKVPKVTLRVHRKMNKRKIAKRFLEIEERKAEILERIELEKEQPKDSEDLLFFKSLLGFMEMFTPAQNLRVRNKIQAVIIDEINASANYYPNRNNKFHV